MGREGLVQLDLFCGDFDFRQPASHVIYSTHVMYGYTTDMSPAAMGEHRAAYRGGLV